MPVSKKKWASVRRRDDASHGRPFGKVRFCGVCRMAARTSELKRSIRGSQSAC